MVVYRDTILNYILPGKIERDTIKVNMPIDSAALQPVIIETDYAKAIAQLQEHFLDNKYQYDLSLELEQKEINIPVKLDSVLITQTDTIRVIELRTITKTKKQPLNVVFMVGFFLSLGILILALYFLTKNR